MIKDQTIGSARAEKDRANSRIIQRLMTALLASALTLPSLAAWGTESSPERVMARYAAFATNPVSRFDALDELEDISADTEDRYAHVAERHALGCPEIASGYELADFELMAASISNAGSNSRSALR